MVIITFTYLIIPSGRFTGISRNIAEGNIRIPNEDLVDNLHAEIQRRLPDRFSNVPFFLRAFHPGPVEYRVMRQGNPISQYFSDSPTADVYHVLVEEDVYHYYTLQ